MDWPDDEFEAFLRQFRPRKPKALPTHRRTVVAFAMALGMAAVVTAAVVIPARFWSKGPAANGSTPTSASAPSATTKPGDGIGQGGRPDLRPAATLNHGPHTNTTPPDVEKKAPAVSGPQMLFPLRDVRQRGSTPSNGPVNATSGAANRRLRVGGPIKPPIKLVDVKPVYPEDARAAGIEGVIILEIVIGENGSVIEARVLRSIPELDQAAIDAVSQWQFEPTLLNGEPVELEMNVTVNFTLR
jgi:TonB family protein